MTDKQFNIGVEFNGDIQNIRQNVREKFLSFLSNENFEKYLKEEGRLLINCQFMSAEEYSKRINNG